MHPCRHVYKMRRSMRARQCYLQSLMLNSAFAASTLKLRCELAVLSSGTAASTKPIRNCFDTMPAETVRTHTHVYALVTSGHFAVYPNGPLLSDPNGILLSSPMGTLLTGSVCQPPLWCMHISPDSSTNRSALRASFTRSHELVVPVSEC